MKNWKTTLMGCIAGVFALVLPIIQAGDFSKLETKDFIIAAIAVVWGIVQKDSNVTGGTVPQ
jgi:hypothetical protein